MSKVEQTEFHPSGMTEKILSDEGLTPEQKKKLIAALGPDAGVFASAEAPSDLKANR